MPGEPLAVVEDDEATGRDLGREAIRIGRIDDDDRALGDGCVGADHPSARGLGPVTLAGRRRAARDRELHRDGVRPDRFRE